MISLQNTWIARHFNSAVKADHIDILFKRLGPSLFKTASGKTELSVELGHRIFEYLWLLDIHLLKRVNKQFQACINEFNRSVFKRRSCFDFSDVSDTQLITYFFQDKIHPFILKAFGRALVEAPFLGRFEDGESIPSHEGHAIARGLVATNPAEDLSMWTVEPFISFYVERRDKKPFTASTIYNDDNQVWRVQTSVPAVRFIYVRGLNGYELFSINRAETMFYLPDRHPDEYITKLGNLDSGFDMRIDNWKLERLLFISQIFENLDKHYIPFTSKIPIRESISIELIAPAE